MIVTVILAAAIMLVLAVIMGWVLGWANHAFAVEVDERVSAINEVLPGANCGGCGYVGCNDYAEAVVRGEAPPNKCSAGGAACSSAIASIMGVTIEESAPYRPIVHCAAKYEHRLKRASYSGEMTCGSANVISGIQGCTYGCLGFGDCERACPFDAIHVVDGLAEVDYIKCTGCSACAKACPRNIITMVPFKAEQILAVKCSNKDFGTEVREVCTVGCIGCKACEKNSSLFKVDNNVPSIDYDHYDPKVEHFEKVLEKCPRQSLVFVGKPTAKDLAAVASEHLPERVEADFKTTVDDTEWRG